MPTLGAWKLRQPEFLFIVPATLLLFLISPLLAPGSVSPSTSLSVFSFASILAVAAIGVAGAWFLDRLLANMLVGVKVHDPVSLSLAWALMTLIALVGSCVPARNAARTNMMSVLHSE